MHLSLPRVTFITLFTCLFLVAHASFGQGSDVDQDEVTKAKFRSMYLMNFTKYTTWPKGALQDSFYVGIVNDDLLVSKMKEVADVKKILGKPISVQLLTDFTQLSSLNLLYVNIDPAMDFDAMHAAIADASVLLVTDNYDIERSMIHFVEVGKQLKYEINLKEITGHQMKVDQTLSNLATRVIE